MSTATSNPATSPSINPQLQLEPMFMSSEPENSRHRPVNTALEPSSRRVIAVGQNVYERVTFWEVLRYWWTNLRQSNHNNNNSTPTPPQLWFVQNVHPLVTVMRIFWFSMSHVSFLIAYGFLMETDFYKSATSHGSQARLLLFFLAATGHTIWLICLLFFSFCSIAHEKCKHNYLLKSIGEFKVLLLVSLLILGIGHRPHEADDNVVAAPRSAYDGKLRFSEVAGLLTCVFLTVDALCVINLLKPVHHYSVFEVTTTLTLHFGLEGSFNFSIPAVCLFIFVILVIKNFLWRNVGRVEEPTDSWQHHLAWVAPEAV